jgi:hypothetical protein
LVRFEEKVPFKVTPAALITIVPVSVMFVPLVIEPEALNVTVVVKPVVGSVSV